MISEDDLFKATNEIKDVLEKYSEKPLDALLIIQYMKWLVESAALADSMSTILGRELKPPVKVKVE